MPTIDSKQEQVTVIVDTKFPGESHEKVLEIIQDSLKYFAKKKGFVSASIHVSREKGRLVNYLQWETFEDHLACANDPDWAKDCSELMNLLESGEIQMDVQVYDVVVCQEASASP